MGIGGGSAGGASGAIRAGAAYVELMTKDSALVKGLDRARVRVMAFARSMAAVGKTLFTVGGSATVAPLVAAIDGLNGMAKLGQTAKALGLTGEEASKLFGIFEASGSDVRDGTEAILTFSGKVTDALSGVEGDAQKLFQQLGVSADEFAGLNVSEQFYKLVEALRRIEDPAKRAGLLLKSLGEDSGKNLLGVLSMTSDEMEKLGETFKQTSGDFAVAEAASKSYKTAVATLGALWRQVVVSLAPTIQEISDLFVAAVKPVLEFVKQNRHLVVTALTVAAAVAGAGIAFLALAGVSSIVATAFGTISAAITGAGAIVGSLGAGLAALIPAVPIIAAVGVGIAALGAGAAYVAYMAWPALLQAGKSIVGFFSTSFGPAIADAASALRTGFADITAVAAEAFGGINEALKAKSWTTAAEIGWLGIKTAFQLGINAVQAAAGKFWLQFSDGSKSALNKAGRQFIDFAGEALKALAEVSEGVKLLFAEVVDSIKLSIAESLRDLGKMSSGANAMLPSFLPGTAALKLALGTGQAASDKVADGLEAATANRQAAREAAAAQRVKDKSAEIDARATAFAEALDEALKIDPAKTQDALRRIDLEALTLADFLKQSFTEEMNRMLASIPKGSGGAGLLAMADKEAGAGIAGALKRVNFAAKQATESRGTFSSRNLAQTLGGTNTVSGKLEEIKKVGEKNVAVNQKVLDAIKAKEGALWVE